MHIVKKTVTTAALVAAAIVACSPVAGAATTTTADSHPVGLVDGLLDAGIVGVDGVLGGLL